jgi:hypothetical protein
VPAGPEARPARRHPAVIEPNSPSASSLGPAVKNSVFTGSLFRRAVADLERPQAVHDDPLVVRAA